MATPLSTLQRLADKRKSERTAAKCGKAQQCVCCVRRLLLLIIIIILFIIILLLFIFSC
jgi:hypothetical protein